MNQTLTNIALNKTVNIKISHFKNLIIYNNIQAIRYPSNFACLILSKIVRFYFYIACILRFRNIQRTTRKVVKGKFPCLKQKKEGLKLTLRRYQRIKRASERKLCRTHVIVGQAESFSLPFSFFFSSLLRLVMESRCKVASFKFPSFFSFFSFFFPFLQRLHG